MDEMAQLNRQQAALLLEALDMLEDIKHKMALFDRQRYNKWKTKLNNHNTLPAKLQLVLTAIETEDGAVYNTRTRELMRAITK